MSHIYEEWTKKEIDIYQEFSNKKIEILYASTKLPMENPADRARFLVEDILKLGMTDNELIMKVASNFGKPIALRLLENMAVSDLGLQKLF